MIGTDNLDASIILQGLSTTHPSLLSDIANNTAKTQAEVQEVRLQGQLIPSEIQKNVGQGAYYQANADLQQWKNLNYYKSVGLMPKDDLSGNQTYISTPYVAPLAGDTSSAMNPSYFSAPAAAASVPAGPINQTQAQPVTVQPPPNPVQGAS